MTQTQTTSLKASSTGHTPSGEAHTPVSLPLHLSPFPSHTAIHAHARTLALYRSRSLSFFLFIFISLFISLSRALLSLPVFFTSCVLVRLCTPQQRPGALVPCRGRRVARAAGQCWPRRLRWHCLLPRRCHLPIRRTSHHVGA